MEDFKNYPKRKAENITHFIVVIEDFRNGYIVALMDSQEEAESLGMEIISRSRINEFWDLGELAIPYRPIAGYKINGNLTVITNSIWEKFTDRCLVYVVGVNLSEGGLNSFIRERENGSELISLDDHLKKFQRVTEKFKGFSFGAN